MQNNLKGFLEELTIYADPRSLREFVVVDSIVVQASSRVAPVACITSVRRLKSAGKARIGDPYEAHPIDSLIAC